MQKQQERRKLQAPAEPERQFRQFTVEFKEAAARRLLAGESGTALSRDVGVKRSVLYRWRDAYRAEGRAGLSRPPKAPGGPPRSA